MPLETVVESLDAVPEAARGAYVERNGKFVLDVELPDVEGLKKALNSERGARGALEKKIKTWESLGKSPDEIAELTAKAQKDAEESARKAGDFDGILKQHQEKWGTERSSLLSKAEAIAAERDSALNVARKAVVDADLKSSLVNNKATSSGMSLLPQILGSRVKTEFVDGEFQFTILAADGKTPLVGNGTAGSATFDDLVKEARTSFPDLFEGSGAGGGGKSSRDAGGAGGSNLMKLPPVERMEAARAQQRR